MKWARYTQEQREWAIQQMMPPLNRAVGEAITFLLSNGYMNAAPLERHVRLRV